MKKNIILSNFTQFLITIIGTALIFVFISPHPALAEHSPAPPSYAQFCPSGKAYEDPSCSPKQTAIQDAITDAHDAAVLGTSGTIYLESGVFSGCPIIIVDFDYGTSLTIQGGVNGGTTTFISGLDVENNDDLDLTLLDVSISVSDPVLVEPGFDANANTGDIVLNNIHVNNNYNSIGIEIINHTGNVVIQHGSANSNKTNNINLLNISGGVTISDFTADASVNGDGIAISGIAGKTGVTMQDVSASGNYGSNISIVDIYESVKLSRVTANSSLHDDGIYIYHVMGKSGVSLTDVTADENAQQNILIGLVFYDLSMTNIEAIKSKLSYGIGISSIQGKKGVNINGGNISYNNQSNLIIDSVSSIVNISNLTTDESVSGNGIDISNVSGSKGVMLTNVISKKNVDQNIYIHYILGDATLKGIESNGAGNGGITTYGIQGKKGVTLADIYSSENKTANIWIQQITSNVSIKDTTANNSPNGYGVYLFNIQGTKGVTLTNIAASGNVSDNIHVDGITGKATLKNITGNNSAGGHGLYLTGVLGNSGVNLNGVNANGNNLGNIYIGDIFGNVALTAVTANSSATSKGIEISYILGTKGLTIKNAFASGNANENIYLSNITSNVSITSTEASESVNESGIYIDTINGLKGVTLSNVKANENNLTGIKITNIASGVKLSGIQANNSTGEYGVFIDYVAGKNGVFMSGVTAEKNNKNNITIADVTYDANVSSTQANNSAAGHGLYIHDIQGPKGVSLKTITAEYNKISNIMVINITGNVDLKTVNADGCTNEYGVWITNIDGLKGVSINGINANSNKSDNISISFIDADVSLSNVQASSSISGKGIRLDTINGSKGVSMKTVTASENSGDNVYTIYINPGNVIMTAVTADSSVSGKGTNIGGVTGTILVISSQFNQNGKDGFTVKDIKGLVALKYVKANGNLMGSGGVFATENNQLVCSSEFSSNNGYGIVTYADGYSITLSAVTFSSNVTGDFYSSGSIYRYDSTKCAVILAP